jgi:hypothetical protein
MGWLGAETAEPEFARLAGEFSEFQLYGDEPPMVGVDRPFVWDFAKKINNGEHLPTYYQQVGDCVSMGAAHAGNYLSAYQIYRERLQQELKLWYPPYIYGTSRVQVGGGRIRGDGSTGAWAAVAMKKYGVLFSDDPDVPAYSGSIARDWGRAGPPDRYLQLASSRIVHTAARLTSVDQLREALLNYHIVTIASGRGFNMDPVEYRGFHVFKPSGSWAHQMTFIGWRDEPFAGAYRLNSWGAKAHGEPMNGEPPGGAWNLASDIEQELSRYDVELYALSVFDGFPRTDIDFSLV